MTRGQKTLRDVEDAQELAKQTESRYLSSHGWKYVCNTPGSIWLWEKKLPDDRVVLASQASALYMEGFLSQDDCDQSQTESGA